MASLFSLSAECSSDADAHTFAEYFESFLVELPSGASHRCGTYVVGTPGSPRHDLDGYWAVVCPDGVGISGVVNDDDQKRMDAIAVNLYARLRTAPPFRYALVGVEVDGFCFFHELRDNDVQRFDGLVFSDAVWHHVDSRPAFIPFSSGYRLRPFIKVL